ncbi:MAG: protease pro-enzyme activation domain-containing protein [Polyangiaceae bacterium]|jgi:MYXO-CTERM domain-containing protein
MSPGLVLVAAALYQPAGAAAAAPAPVNVASGLVTLPGSVHPFVRRSVDEGRLDPSRHLTGMSVLLQPSAAQKGERAKLLRAMQDPTSPSYHRWLRPEDYASRFGASPADVARVSAWLGAHGLTVDGPSRTATRIGFSGDVGSIESAFATELHAIEVAGADHFAMTVAPSIPVEFQGLVLGLHGMNDFRPAPPRHRAPKPRYAFPEPTQDGGTENIPVLAPADFAAIYDLNSLYAAGINGTGQSIAVAEQTEFVDDDITVFRSKFNLPANPPVRHLVPNTGAAATSRGDVGEAMLDTEWAGAVAPAATIDYVYTGAADNNGAFDALLYAVEQDIAPLVSLSYGTCESGLTPADGVFYEAMGDSAAIMGITVLVASGDSGAAGCDADNRTGIATMGEFVGIPASIPSLTAVGGTEFALTQANVGTYLDSSFNASGYIPEVAWGDTQADIDAGFPDLNASTGGVSVVYSKPYWQVPYTPKDKGRDVPDVALSASDEVLPYITVVTTTHHDGGTSQRTEPVGGTSAAAPSFAGILALVNQSLAKAHPTAAVGLGNANPVLYALANNPSGAAAFHDITQGSNICPCAAGSPSCPTTPPLQFGYTCGVGYDQVTGLGSVDGAKLVAAWSELTPTSTALKVGATTATEGQMVQLSATVSSMATMTTLTGSVTFYVETFDSQGNLDLGATLGSVPVTPSTSGNEGGTASLTVAIPGGLGTGKVGAFYGGDIDYLASWSPLSALTTTSTLAICPAAITLASGQKGLTFKATGGVGATTFNIVSDSTCSVVGMAELCSTLDSSGAFTAGPADGTVVIEVTDTDNSEARATVTVVSADGGTDGGATLPVTGCGSSDGGIADAAVDATGPTTTPVDASDADAGTQPPASKGGCSCSTTGEGSDLADLGLGGAMLGLVAFGWRRRPRR